MPGPRIVLPSLRGWCRVGRPVRRSRERNHRSPRSTGRRARRGGKRPRESADWRRHSAQPTSTRPRPRRLRRVPRLGRRRDRQPTRHAAHDRGRSGEPWSDPTSPLRPRRCSPPGDLKRGRAEKWRQARLPPGPRGRGSERSSMPREPSASAGALTDLVLLKD
jgi:hypothetical protein